MRTRLAEDPSKVEHAVVQDRRNVPLDKVERRLELVESNETLNRQISSKVLDRGEDESLNSRRRPGGVASLGLEVDGGGDGGFGRFEAENVLELGN